MPNNFNFNVLSEIKEIKVNPVGWVDPLIVEYGIGEAPEVSYFWRVKGTGHTFVIPVKRLNYISSGNYEKHFEKVLELFREDYISWKKSGFYLNWMREYEEQFARFIIP